MKTYDDSTIKIVYPKGAALSVKSSKKALGAEITKQKLEDPYADYGYEFSRS